MKLHKLITIAGIICFIFLTQNAFSEVNTLTVKLNAITVYVENNKILGIKLRNDDVIHTVNNKLPYSSSFNMNDRGMIFFEDKIIDSVSGEIVRDFKKSDIVMPGPHYKIEVNKRKNLLVISRGHKICNVPLATFGFKTKKDNIFDDSLMSFVDSSGPLVALLINRGHDMANTRYYAVSFQTDSCRVESSVNFGYPDNLIELGWSPRGGWWIVGIKEVTLLRSNDGKIWRSVSLPEEFSELMSAYIVNDNDIWLAANDGRIHDTDGPMLINSSDGGKTWVPVTWDSPLIKKVPLNWLEGQLRVQNRGKY